jgi:hypothetical protein
MSSMSHVATDKHAWTKYIKEAMGKHWEEFGQPFVALADKYGMGFHSVKGLKGEERKEMLGNNEAMSLWFCDIANLYIQTRVLAELNTKKEVPLGHCLMKVFEHAARDVPQPKSNGTVTLNIKCQLVVDSPTSYRLGLNEADIVMTIDNPPQLAAEDLD